MKILAFGDSLTWGYVRTVGMLYDEHPYTQELQKELTQCFGNQVEVVNRGVNGSRAVDMLDRLQKEIQENRYDYILILAGTNDLGAGKSNDEIQGALSELYKSAKKNSKLVVFTVPRMFTRPHHAVDVEAQKNKLNTWIVNYAKKSKVLLYDAYRKIQPNKKNFSDTLHFSRSQYDRLGQDLAQLITSDIVKTVQGKSIFQKAVSCFKKSNH